MINTFETKDFSNIVMVGDKILIKPETEKDRTKSGLYLPAGLSEKEKVLSGYVIKTGPGYPVPSMQDEDEAWKSKDNSGVKYLPLQIKAGDLAVFLQNSVWEIFMNGEKYFIVPNSSVLMLLRNEDLF
ncbi:MAG: co-chaperone GroES family protein [Prevotellaceae bacterium]|jgi:co-chaperonin GroES (HSP10)|nr:co-chaperone GroES family protein [Prevotellaceae bacterium]